MFPQKNVRSKGVAAGEQGTRGGCRRLEEHSPPEKASVITDSCAVSQFHISNRSIFTRSLLLVTSTSRVWINRDSFDRAVIR